MGEVLKDGFNYDGFCSAIDASDQLSNAQQTFAKDILNPNKRITGSFVRMRAGKAALAPKVEPLPEEHGLHITWNDVWNDTKQRYSKEVSKYEKMIAKKNRNKETGPTDSSVSEPVYPHRVPNVKLLKTDALAAVMLRRGDAQTLFITDGFFRLPLDQQKATLYHEANHAFEPVVHNIAAKNYDDVMQAVNMLTLDASNRFHELKADKNAAIFGHGPALAKVLGQLTESAEPQLKDEYILKAAIAKAALENGLQFDKRKIAEIMRADQPTTVKEHILSTQLGSTLAATYFDKAIKRLASKNLAQLLEERDNPKLWGIKVGKYPPMAERIAHLNKDNGNAR